MSQVLVVGAGPVGLTLACELARHGQRCRIVDKLAEPSSYCKAIGMTPRTLELWEMMGIVNEMIDEGLWIKGARTVIGGKVLPDHIIDLLQLPYNNLGIPQYATERVLTRHLQRLGLEVERGVTVDACTDLGSEVEVELSGESSGRKTARFRYVVGCDGAHSVVRKQLGIGFPGEGLGLDFMLGDVEIDWDLPRGLSLTSIVPKENAAPDLFVAIPLPDKNRYRITMLAPPESAAGGEATAEDHGISAERQGPPLAELQAVADRLLPGKPRLAALRWSSLFRISMRLADRYRLGNLFLAGDAAHIHPPTGGQGMNTGIQDAVNLAWKMALVLSGAAGPALLDTYEPERRPVGADVVARTTAATTEHFGERRGQEDPLQNAQIYVNYRGGPLAADIDLPAGLELRAGDRVPDVHGLTRDQVHFPLRLFDILRGPAFVLVTYLDGPTAAEVGAGLAKLAGELARGGGIPVRVVAVAAAAADGLPDPIGFSLFLDGEGAFARTYGAQPGLTMMVRPDGYLGLLAGAFQGSSVLAYLDKLAAAPAAG